MALVHADGFDKYSAGVADTARIGRRGTKVALYFESTGFPGNQVTIVAGAGRFGNNAARFEAATSGGVNYSVEFSAAATKIRAGFWLKQGVGGSSLGSVGAAFGGLPVEQDLTPTHLLAVQLVTFKVFVAGVQLTTLSNDLWRWIEIEHNSVNSTATLYIDGLLIGSVGGITRTSNFISVGASGIVGSASVSLIDDIVWWDNLGTSLSSFPIGPQRIATLVPDAPGTTTQFAPASATNWQSLTGSGAFGGTGNLGTTTPLLDYVRVSDLPWAPFSGSGAVAFVALTDVGQPGTSLRPRLSLGGTEYIGDPIAIPVFQSEIHATPTSSGSSAGSAPSILDFNNAQAGYEIV
jgi:hypothetical protein